jgi:ankyrin repeat protein
LHFTKPLPSSFQLVLHVLRFFPSGKTALIFSAEKGHKEVAKVLLENNFVTADVNMVDKK